MPLPTDVGAALADWLRPHLLATTENLILSAPSAPGAETAAHRRHVSGC